MFHIRIAAHSILALTLFLSTSLAAASEYRFDDVDRVVSMSDVDSR